MSEGSAGHQTARTSIGQVPMDRLHTIFDGMFDGVWLVGGDGRTTYANEAMARLLGTGPAAMRGRPLTDFVEERRWPEVESFLERQQTHAGERIGLTLRRADGSDLLGLVAGSPILTADGDYVGTMLNVSDVTGKSTMDAQLAQRQRLEAIGAFAGGVAHDFNNLLTSIRGYAELARSQTHEGDPIRADLEQVVASTEKAGGLTKTLLAFTRQQVLVPMDLDPAALIHGLLPILRPLMNDGIEIVLDVDGPHDWIRADPGQVEQVLVNLAVNARDAMPAGGTMTITVRNLEATDPERPDADLTAGPYVRIVVADTGTGMDEATRARIFDPFFTTKEMGRGTGLGLATVFGIVAQSGGQIQVETDPGHGSSFHVDLPRVSAGTTAAERAESQEVPGTGVILLVEDESAVRDFARRALEKAGYSVLTAADANQAVAASDRAERIDILLTDIVMPGTHGPALAERIRAGRPGVRVVFMSGYADRVVNPRGTAEASGLFLSKPFSIEALTRIIAQAIATGPDAARKRLS
jgi:two-component system cell cycle sensor histidine kinase/response regulator CckA